MIEAARRSSRELAGAELLDRYAVDHVLGGGGMATVYAGRHITIGRSVAIKVLHDEFAEKSEPVSWFLLEARAASRIRQENVVEITDFGTTPEGLVFLVMELLDGENLSHTITRHGALPWARVAAIMLQICGALAAAHAVGVVHRDLKPANCFRITRGVSDDFIKVLDFGIATVTARGGGETAPRRTRVGLIVGTPGYMAPEQVRAEVCDHRVDVYAAGAILYELATARPPYEADSSSELMACHIHAPVPDPCAIVSGLPPAVSAIVARAMAKEPGERFAGMDELAAAIRAVPTEPAELPRRSRGGWMVAAAVSVVAATGWIARVGAADDGGSTPVADAAAQPHGPSARESPQSPVVAPTLPVVVLEQLDRPLSPTSDATRASASVPSISAVPPEPPTGPRVHAKRRPATKSPRRVQIPAAPTAAPDELDPAPRSEVKNPFAD